MTSARCLTCGTVVRPERPLDQVALMRLMDAHDCELRFDPENEATWRWLPMLLGAPDPTACLDCGFVWPAGCHLTEALAHLCRDEDRLACNDPGR